MIILAVDAAGKGLSVAVAGEGRILASAGLNVGLTHSQRLLPLLRSLLAAADLSLSSVDALAVVNGPGSFTGLRIGMATVKGLAWALQKPVVTVSTLEAAAYNALPDSGQADILACPVLDARRNEVYTALYAAGPNPLLLRPLWQPLAIAPAALGDRLGAELQEGQRVAFSGDGAELIFDAMQGALGDRAILVKPERRCFNACACALLAEEHLKVWPQQAKSPGEVGVFYLRASEAERNRLAKLQGATPEGENA